MEAPTIGGVRIPRGDGRTVRLPRGATLTDFADKIDANPGSLVQALIGLGEMATATQSLSDDTLMLLGGELNYNVEVVSPEDEDRELLESFNLEFGEDEGGEEELEQRPPVVTVMGHVDHGKTKLLDAVRHTNLAAREAGGITQHIGAYQIHTQIDGRDRAITFIDTPGHEAFTAMRARGAKATDIAILVVAADDGVMPQTVEAINHAQAADVPIVVAVNKIDKEGAQPEKIRGQLTEYGLVPEEYGGDTMFVDISAKQGTNIEGLLEAVLLTADTSGDPKGVLRTADNLMANCENIAASLDVTADAKILTTVPLFSAYGFDLGLCLALRYGATLYLEDEMSPKRIAKLIREQEIDFLPATPPIYASLAKMPTARPLKTRGARFLATGAQLPEAIADSFRERWGIRVLPIYHTTEGGAISLDRKGLAPETVGKPIPGVELRMGTGDDDGRAPIWIRSKAVALHSVGPMSHIRPGEARSKKGEARAVPIGGIDAEGWLRTGDRGKIDRTNRLTLLGREDDLVKVEGKRVALGEVEGCLESYPKVKAAQARVFTDEDGSTMVVASVVLSGRCRAEELIDHCAKNLAPYKVPRRVELRGSLTDELGGQECAR